ncbi:FAD-binding oxidoreductase [Pseudomonas gingeri]|uniref:NAD(P)/FAD-dependent oxidoreductase n=1 Tax=Pseudomonas gingeri TaxID=117681 RepID=UPI00159F9127|nr:FAD-dependent oxidoreductase [Pseudomonas gingeri]NVZ27965.1 FAD-binding oxidoreductase [Pseudomonas gingeri]
MSPTIFHPSLYDRQHFHASYWGAMTPRMAFTPLTGDTEVEVAIIGGGLAGLSTAFHLARDHHIEALVLEAGDIGWGASGRNAGFNTLPASKLSVEQIFQRWPEPDARAFFDSQREGQELVYSLAKEEGFDLQRCGNGNFTVAHSPGAFRELIEQLPWLRMAAIPCRILTRDEFSVIGHGGPEQFGALHVETGGGLNPLAFTQGLAQSARRHGARICANTPMVSWEKQGGLHLLRTPHGVVRARQVVLATNGYRDDPEPKSIARRVLPAISNILVSAPLSARQWESIGLSDRSPMIDTRMLVTYYRRLPDDRLLLGARSDTWGDPLHDNAMRDRLLSLLARKFPDSGVLGVDYFWRGLLTLTRKFTPTWGRSLEDASVLFNLGCFGSGINTMPWMGRTLARAIAGVPLSAMEDCKVYRQLPGQLPKSPWLQRGGLRLAYFHYALQDCLK